MHNAYLQNAFEQLLLLLNSSVKLAMPDDLCRLFCTYVDDLKGFKSLTTIGQNHKKSPYL